MPSLPIKITWRRDDDEKNLVKYAYIANLLAPPGYQLTTLEDLAVNLLEKLPRYNARWIHSYLTQHHSQWGKAVLVRILVICCFRRLLGFFRCPYRG